MPTPLTVGETKVQGDTVTFSGTGGNALANSLVQKHSAILGELAHSFGFIRPSEISINHDGSVQIKNATTAAKITSLTADKGPEAAVFDTNCSC